MGECLSCKVTWGLTVIVGSVVILRTGQENELLGTVEKTDLQVKSRRTAECGFLCLLVLCFCPC